MAKKANVENTNTEIENVPTPAEVAPVKASAPQVEVGEHRRVHIKENQRRELVKKYLSEEKIPVTISPLYAPYLGKIVPVLVNGIRVDIPADGRTYQINSTHASEVIAKIRRINGMLARQKKAGDVTNNVERTIGELKF